MSSDLQARMDELESRLAFQDDMIENLNRVVARQDREIIQLKQRLGDLSERVRDLDNSAATAGPSAEFEPPPHY